MRVKSILTLLAMVLAFFALGATPAYADSPPAGCTYYDGGTGNNTYYDSCYEYSGDDHWVLDKESNGWSAAAQIETDYGKTRTCVNSETAGNWHECTFDHREECAVRWRLYEVNLSEPGDPTRRFTAWTPWVSVRTGLPTDGQLC